MKQHPASPKHRSERGQSLVEFAITFLVLVLILSVVVDVGRLYFASVAVREAAEEGALYGSMGEFNKIVDRVRQSSSSPIDMEDISKVEVSCPGAPSNDCANLTGPNCLPAGESLTVTVTYQFDFIMPLIAPIIGSSTLPLSHSAVTTVLQSSC